MVEVGGEVEVIGPTILIIAQLFILGVAHVWDVGHLDAPEAIRVSCL